MSYYELYICYVLMSTIFIFYYKSAVGFFSGLQLLVRRLRLGADFYFLACEGGKKSSTEDYFSIQDRVHLAVQ
jgi:hypothetical protein